MLQGLKPLYIPDVTARLKSRPDTKRVPIEKQGPGFSESGLRIFARRKDSRSENASYTRQHDPCVKVRRRISFKATNLLGSFQDDVKKLESKSPHEKSSCGAPRHNQNLKAPGSANPGYAFSIALWYYAKNPSCERFTKLLLVFLCYRHAQIN
jgi:hypothetical protein